MTKNSFGVEMKTKNGLKSADLDGDGHVTDEELDVNERSWRFKTKMLCEMHSERWLGLLYSECFYIHSQLL